MANTLLISMYPTRQTSVIMQSTNTSGCNITTNQNYLAHVHCPKPTSSALPIPPKRTRHVTNSFHFVGTLISPTWIPTFTGPSILLPFMVAKDVTALIRRIGGLSDPASICFITWFLWLRFRPTPCTLTHAPILHFTTLLCHARYLHLSMTIQCQNTGSYILDKRSSIYSQPLPFIFYFFWEPLGVRRSFSRPAAITLFDRLFGPLPSMELFHAKIQFSQTLHLWAHLARCASMSLSSIFGLLKGHSP